MTIRTDISARLRDGRKIARRNYQEQDALKLGVLRAGNSGIASEDGEVAASCHRVAHLRQLGIEVDPPDDNTVIMFQLGTANELVVYDDLVHTASEGEVILREEEIPIEWFTANGTRVTGRPDMVICDLQNDLGAIGQGPEGTRFVSRPNGLYQYVRPLLTLELKSVASVWTSRSVLFDGEPKLPHLAQVAHYMWKLGTPGRLIYKQYAIQEIPHWDEMQEDHKTGKRKKVRGWGQKLFPREGQPNSEYIDYEKGRIRPFEVVYELEFTPDGTLKFKREDLDTDWTLTIVSTQDIERFYSLVSTMQEHKSIGPRPLTLGPDGESKRYSNCDYCPLSGVCDAAEELPEGDQYVQWLSEVRTSVGKRTVDNRQGSE